MEELGTSFYTIVVRDLSSCFTSLSLLEGLGRVDVLRESKTSFIEFQALISS